MQLVLSRLQTESVDAGKGTVFNALKSFLTCEEDKTPCAEAAQNLNTSENNVKVMVHRLRQRYRELLRAEIAHTGATPEQVEEEIRDLFAALA
jgi:hypothetical protein